jgi:plasmid stabilization system protein ParE
MTLYTVGYAPEAEDQLLDLFEFIAKASGNAFVAAQFVEAITRFCDGFERFSHRGERRDDIRPGLRITNYDGRTIIAFTVDDDAERVDILGVFYGGQDYASHLNEL